MTDRLRELRTIGQGVLIAAAAWLLLELVSYVAGPSIAWVAGALVLIILGLTFVRR